MNEHLDSAYQKDEIERKLDNVSSEIQTTSQLLNALSKNTEIVNKVLWDSLGDTRLNNARLFKIIIGLSLIVCLCIGIISWQYYEFRKFISESEIITITQDGEGQHNINRGEQGDINYGSKYENYKTEEQ